MLYQLEQGKTEEEIIRQCQLHRMPLPDKIANAPTLELGLDFYFTAFTELTTCRPVGMGEGMIPWTAIKEWGVFNKLDEEEFYDFKYLISAMDSAYIDFKVKKMKAST